MTTLAEDLETQITARLSEINAVPYDHNLTAMCEAMAAAIQPRIDVAVEDALSKETGLLVVNASSAVAGNLTLTFDATHKAIVLMLDANITGTLTIVPYVSAANRATNLNITIVQSGGGNTINAWAGIEWSDDTVPDVPTADGGVTLIAAMYDGTTTTARFVGSPGFVA